MKATPDKATKYARDVLAGKYTTGRLVQLACKRHLLDLENGEERGHRWRPELGEEVEEFIASLHHFKGRWGARRDPFTLEPWQCFIVYSIFGWQRQNDEGRWVRRFRTAYDEVARKNGKSSLLAVVGLYLFAMDEEPGSEVYTVATKLDQAKIMHGFAQQFVRHSELSKHVKNLTYNLSIESSASKYEPLGSDSKTLDGLGPNGGLIDEYHAHPTAELYNVIKTGMGSRDQPLLFIITTAGESLDSPCGREREFATGVLEATADGSTQNDSYFAYIASPDKDDDPEEESTWAKGNPNLGVSIRLEDLRVVYAEAREKPLEYNDFLRKRLNIWTETRETWISFEATSRWWKACGGEMSLEGRKCYGGLDLSTVLDLSSFALMFEPRAEGDPWSLLLRVWCPKDGLAARVRKDRVPYDVWQERGWLKATEGTRVDYRVIKSDILAMIEGHELVDIGYDPWNAEKLTQELADDEGLPLFEVRQGFQSLSGPMKHLESLIFDSALEHGGNESVRWMLGNMAVRRDENDNIAPSKKKATERIDGIVAAIMALARAMRAEDAPPPSRWDTEGAELLVV